MRHIFTEIRITWLMLLSVSITSVSTLLEVISVYMLGQVLEPDQIIKNWLTHYGIDSTNFELVILLIFILVGLAAIFMRNIGMFTAIKLRIVAEYLLRENFLNAVIKLTWQQFKLYKVGELVKVVLAEAHQIGTALQIISNIISNIVASLLIFIFAFYLAPESTSALIIFGIAAGFISISIKGLVKRKSDKLSTITDLIGSNTRTFFNEYKFFSISGIENKAIMQILNNCSSYCRQLIESNYWSLIGRMGSEIIALLMMAVFLFYETLYKGSDPIDTLVLLGVFSRLAPRLVNLQNDWFQYQLQNSWVISYANRIKEIKNNTLKELKYTSLDFRERITVENLSLLNDLEIPILKNLDFKIERNTTTVLFGPSGSGKTLTLDILAGIINPSRGDILVDGKSLAQYSRHSWSDQFSYLGQSFPLFTGTLRENLLLGLERDATDEALLEVLDRVGLLSFVKNSTLGLNLLIEEDGRNISGGQRQRIGIARLLLLDKEILFLDEPTSALDLDNRDLIYEVLKKLKGNKTIILVTHDKSFLKIADQIINISDGAIT